MEFRALVVMPLSQYRVFLCVLLPLATKKLTELQAIPGHPQVCRQDPGGSRNFAIYSLESPTAKRTWGRLVTSNPFKSPNFRTDKGGASVGLIQVVPQVKQRKSKSACGGSSLPYNRPQEPQRPL